MTGRNFKQKMCSHTTWAGGGAAAPHSHSGSGDPDALAGWFGEILGGAFSLCNLVFMTTGGANDSRRGLFIKPHCPMHCYNVNL